MLFYFETQKTKNILSLKNIIDLSNGEIKPLDEFLQLDGVAYVNDLNSTFMTICKRLNALKYKNVYHATNPCEYSFLYKNGECLNIKICHQNGKKFDIVNFEKKFLQEYQDLDTSNLLMKYAKENERNSHSLGVDAFNEFLRLTFKRQGHTLNINACYEVFRRDYPIINEPLLEQAKTLTQGFQFAKKGYYENIYNFDICSAYPAQLINDTPKGEPKEFESLESVPASYFYILKVTFFRVKIKPNCMDFASANNSNIITLVLTQHLYNLFLNNYNFEAFKIKRIIGFKTTKNRFDEFLFKNIINGKINGIYKPLIKYNKAIANSIIGYLGKNTYTEQTKLQQKGGKISIISEKVKKEPVYLPLYLYATGKEKAEFILTLQKIGLNKVIYANTDGFLTTDDINIDRLNFGRNDELGAFKRKTPIKQIYIDCINGYTAELENGEIDNTISGMRLLSAVSVKQYQQKQFKYTLKQINDKGDIEEYEISTDNNDR